MLPRTVPIEIRSVTGYDELERWVAARNQVLPDDPENAEMMALVRASEIEHVDLLAYEDGLVVGTGMLAGDPSSLESSHPYVEVTVLPEHRGRGTGTLLMQALSDHARRLGKRGLQCEARAHDDHSVAFLERRGFAEYGRSDMLVLELRGGEASSPEPPEGIELVSLSERPDLLQGMYEVAAATYPELSGYLAMRASTFHEWQVYELGNPGLVLEMTPIALAGDEVVGFATLIRRPEDRSAEHRMAMVLPGWRHRGIATALVRAQIEDATCAGLESLLIWERGENRGRLYEKLGFERRGATIGFRGPLL